VGKRRENLKRFSATHIFTFCSISSAFFTIGAFQRPNSQNILNFRRFWGSLKLKKGVNLVRFWRFYEILWDSTGFCEILKILRDSEDSMRFLRFWKDSEDSDKILARVYEDSGELPTGQMRFTTMFKNVIYVVNPISVSYTQ
jgi:hypothetical protein